ncbi:hypothetical protein Q8A67_014022 [Cirrhinus molitorella]|uniref:Uncharacterized protein n=1 Tax=Cirrhinus molitorella TaxID=172907 RepID=A0AA88PR64_9TELE|nr:hypothetical protein Q8A67_014022 [Cirrhinus molitorella]
MANLVLLECHLWLNLKDIRDAEKMAFPNSLLGDCFKLEPGLETTPLDGQKVTHAKKACVHSPPLRTPSSGGEIITEPLVTRLLA